MNINHTCPVCHCESNMENPFVLNEEEAFLCEFCSKNMSHEDARKFLAREENESYCDYRVRMRLKRLFLTSSIIMLKKPIGSGNLVFLFCRAYQMIKSNKSYGREFFNFEYSSHVLDYREAASCCITCGEEITKGNLECKYCDHEKDYSPGFNFEIDNDPA